MAETTADVRRDIELTRERMSTTLQQLEQKLNIKQVVRDNPWPALALAVGAGVLLSGSRTDVKAAAATVAATRGASTKVGTVLDDVVANLVSGLHDAFETRVTGLVNELKSAIGVPAGTGARPATGDQPVARSAAAGQQADTFDRGDVRSAGEAAMGFQPRAPTDRLVLVGARRTSFVAVGRVELDSALCFAYRNVGAPEVAAHTSRSGPIMMPLHV